MSKLLFIESSPRGGEESSPPGGEESSPPGGEESSPRGDNSFSTRAAQAFVEALPGSVEVDRVDLWQTELPTMAGAATAAKYNVINQREHSDEEARAWKEVQAIADRFAAADTVLITVPMWNFGIPYKLKQYIDVITQPGMLFKPSDDGYEALNEGRAVLVYARGGDYSPKGGEPDPFDFQTEFMHAWLGFVGVDVAGEVAVQQTMGDNDTQQSRLREAQAQLRKLAAELF